MKKLLLLLAGLAIIAMVAVPAIIMQPEDNINPTTQSVNVVPTVDATSVFPQATAIPTQTPVASEPGITYELEFNRCTSPSKSCFATKSCGNSAGCYL